MSEGELPPLRRAPRVLVAGLGNELCGDDGVGAHVVRRLASSGLLPNRSDLQVVEVGIAVLDASHLWEWADRILAIDAMRGVHAPGSTYLVNLEELESGDRRQGLHAANLADALRLSPGHHWDEILVLGIEPEALGLGLELSRPVEAAVADAAARAARITDAWLAG